ncbi:MAG: hypothetical protein KUG77_13000, partial [Nannocystaceae bacterium]|nr:hypothetical protein [Nannocystaceae bacterium]
MSLFLAALLSSMEPSLQEPVPRHPAEYVLRWQAPHGCPDEDWVAQEIERWVLGARGGQGVMRAEAVVVETDDGFALTLTTTYLGQPDTRELAAPRCEELADMTALVVSFAIDPLLAEGPKEDSLVPEPDGGPAPPQPVRSKSPPVEERSPRFVPLVDHEHEPPVRNTAQPRAVVVRIAPAFEAGAMPSVGAGATAAVGLQWVRLRAEVYGLYLPPQRGETPFSAAAVYQLGAAGARGCMRWGHGVVRVPTCVGVEGGSLRVESRQLDPERTLRFPWLSPTLGVGLSVEGRRVGLWSLAEVGVPVFRSRVFVGEETAWQAFPVTLSLPNFSASSATTLATVDSLRPLTATL